MYIPDSLIDVYGKRIGPYGAFVYLCLASQAKETGEAAIPTQYLAEILGISVRQIFRALETLEAHHLITITRVRNWNVYSLNLPDRHSELPDRHSELPDRHSELPDRHGSMLFSYTGNGSEIPSLVPPVPDLLPIPDPKILLDPKTQNTKPRARARRTIPTDQPGFDRWWAIYTPSRAMEKHVCLALWIRDDLETRVDDIIAHTLAMQQTRQWQDEEKIPHARTYLSKQQYTAPPPKPAPHQYAPGMTYTQEETDRILDEDDAWRATL